MNFVHGLFAISITDGSSHVVSNHLQFHISYYCGRSWRYFLVAPVYVDDIRFNCFKVETIGGDLFLRSTRTIYDCA